MRISRVLMHFSTVVATLLTVVTIGPSVANAAGTAVTEVSGSPTVSVGGQVLLTASTPIVDPGTVTQSVMQTIDPTKVKLTSIADITYPSGWALTYSTDGSTFTATTPANAAAWAAVRVVKATGPVVSQGTSGGKQIAVGTATQPTVPPLGGFSANLSGGDPYSVSFDDDGRVFTYSHHKNPAAFACYNRDGTTCAGWSGTFAGRQSGYDAYSWVDTVNNRLWYPTWDSSTFTWRGYACIDVTPGSAPVNCNVSGLTNGYLSFGGGFTAPSVSGGYGSIIQSSVAYGGNLYGFDHTTGSVVCANVTTVPLGPCTGGSWVGGESSVANLSNSYVNVNGAQYWGVNVEIYGGKVWAFAKSSGASTPRLACLDPVTGAYCAGWSTSVGAVTGAPNTSSSYGTGPVALPDSSGSIVAVCGYGTSWSCWAIDGSSYTPPSNFASNVYMRSTPVLQNPQTYGTKIYSNLPYMNCYDVTTNATCSSFPLPYGAINGNDYYSIANDPLNPGCIWYAQDAGRIATFNGSTGGTCAPSPTKVNFGVNTVIPRLGCSSTSAIGQWGTFTVTSPVSSAYSNGSVAVVNNGVTVANFNLTNGSADLSTLSVSVTGQSPIFQVSMPNLSGSPSTASASITAIGDSPQLCLNVTALAQCPSGSGPVPTLGTGSFGVIGSGSFTNSSNVTTSLTPATTSVTVGAASTSQCGSTLTGTATLSGGSTPVAGATVTLLDASGNPILVNGQPVTTTTAPDGTYSFGYLLPGQYQVKFSDAGVKSAQTANITSGGSGTVTRGDCTSGTTSTITTNLSWVENPNAGTRTAPTNLITNGDFTDIGSFTTPPYLFWGQKTVQGTATNELNHAVMGYPVVPYPNGVSTGVNGAAIPGWSAAGGGVRTYAMVGPIPNRGTTQGLSTNIVYFGNGQSATVSPSVNWTAQGWSRQALVVSISNSDYGPNTGLTLSQTIATTVGQKYRIQFDQLAEQDQTNDGIAALDITGYGRTFFAVQHATRRIGIEFLATSAATTLTFVAWGHLPLATELAIDDVTVNPCTTSVASTAATVAVGAAAVVNATYIAPTTAAADTSTGAQGVAQTINVLANDAAATGANLSSATLNFCTTDSPASGCTLTTKTVSGQGIYTISGTNVVFTPCSGSNTPAGAGCTGAFTGTATPVAYQVTDSGGGTATALVTPKVVPPPTAVADASTGSYNTSQTITPTSNDTAGSGTTLNTVPAGICTTGTAASSCTGTTLTVANQGTYTLNTTTGVVTFVPLASFTGTATPIEYVAVDALGQKTVSSITPTVLPPAAPTAKPDTTTATSGSAQTINPVTNDVVGATGVTFTATSVKLCSTGQTSPNCTATTLNIAGQGSYSVNATTGVITFTPCSAVNTPAGASCTGPFAGTATPVAYQVTTNTNQTASSTYTPTVIPPPSVVADTGTAGWDVNQTFTPTSNDTAGTGTTLNPVPLGICTNGTAAVSCTGSTLTVANQGTYTLNTTTGVVTFDPLPSFTGTATSIEYVAVDALGQKTPSTITPTVTPPPSPTAATEQKVVLPGSSVNFTTLTGTGGLASSGGPSFTTSATCLINTSVTPNTCGTTLNVAGQGAWSVNTTTGVVTFTPCSAANTPAGASCTGPYSGTVTPVSYKVTDATGATATAALTPIIPAPPTLSPDTSVNEQNATQVVNVLSNDSATAYTTLSPTSVKLCPTNATSPYTASNCNLNTLTVSNEGVYTVNSDGTVSFVPCTAAPAAACPANTKYSGVATSIRYIATDNLGQVANSTITVTVLPPPVAQASNDTGSATFGNPVTINPLANDTGGTTTNLVGYTSTGTATLDPTTVALCAAGQSAPNCTSTSLTTADGVYTVNTSTGAITFTPATNFTGTPSNPPMYQVCNVIGGNWQPMAPPSSCAAAKVIPTIGAPGAPVATNDSSTGAYNTSQVINVLNNDAAASNLTLVPTSVKLCGPAQSVPNCTLTTLTVAGEGTYVVNSNGTVTFTPLPTFSGSTATHPTYQVTDSFGAKVSATITPTVTLPPPPSASPATQTLAPGQTISFGNLIGTSALASGTNLQTGNTVGPCLVDPADSVCKASVTIANQGTFTVDRITGAVTFTAANNASSGTLTPVTYRVTDVVGQTATSTLTPVIPPAPAATVDTSINALDVNQIINILTNDAAGTGTTFDPSTLFLCGVTGTQTAPNCTQTTVTVPGEGVYTVNSDGTVTFDPEPNFAGTATPVGYQVSDSLGRVVSSTITPTVTSVPPVATPATVTLHAGETATFTPIFGAGGLATPASGGPALVNATACIVDPSTNVCGSTVTVSGVGVYTLDPSTGVVTFTAATNATPGTKSPIVYRITDAVGFVATSTLTPTILQTDAAPQTTPITPSNQGSGGTSAQSANKPVTPPSAPTAVDRRMWTGPQVPVFTNPLQGGVSARNSSWVPSKSQLFDPATGRWTNVVTTSSGTWVVIRDNIRFTPAAGFIGNAALPFRIFDTSGQSAKATFSVLVTNTPAKLPATGQNSVPVVEIAVLMLALGAILRRLRLRIYMR